MFSAPTTITSESGINGFLILIYIFLCYIENSRVSTEKPNILNF